LTVADVFVQYGQGHTDGSDQRATVRVIQKPSAHAFIREASVVQDWAAAAAGFERHKEHKKRLPSPRFSTIEEESRKGSVTDSYLSDARSSNNRRVSNTTPAPDIRPEDVPIRSVERDPPIKQLSPPLWGRKSPILAQESPEPGVENTPEAEIGHPQSSELGDSPPPARSIAKLTPVAEAEETNLTVDIEGSKQLPQSASEAPTRDVAADKKLPDLLSKDPAITEQRDEIEDTEMPNVEPNSPTRQFVQRTASPVVLIDNVIDRQEAGTKAKILAVAKRKRISMDGLPPKKEPRLELSSSPTPSTRPKKEKLLVMGNVKSTPNPLTPKRRDRTPSFSSPQRRSSFGEHPPDMPEGALGMGITRSPQTHKVHVLDQTQEASGEKTHSSPLFSKKSAVRRSSLSQEIDSISKPKSPAVEEVKKLSSAMRKDSPVDGNRLRRSVSFADDAEIVTPSRSMPRTVLQPGSKLSVPRSTSGEKSDDPERRKSSEGTMVWPANVDPEKIQQYLTESKQKGTAEKRNVSAAYISFLQDSYRSITEKSKEGTSSSVEKKLGTKTQANAKKPSAKSENTPAAAKKSTTSVSPASGSKSSDRKTATNTKKPAGKNSDKPVPNKASDKQPPKSAASKPKKNAKPKVIETITLSDDDTPPPSRSKTPTKRLEKNDPPKSSIVSDDNNLPPLGKIRGKSLETPRAKPAATRTITKIEVPNDAKGSKSSSSSASESSSISSSEASLASKQIHSEMNQELTQTKPNSSSSSSESESESSSESESDDSDDVRSELFPSQLTSKASRAPLASKPNDPAPRHNFGSNTWYPVNKSPAMASSQPASSSQTSNNKKVSLASLRERQLQEMKTSRNSNKRPPRADPFEVLLSPHGGASDDDSSESESDSDSDRDKGGATTDSNDDDRGDILPTGKAKEMRKNLFGRRK
jgi:hypothetical protein